MRWGVIGKGLDWDSHALYVCGQAEAHLDPGVMCEQG